jgi:hypothetical protein
MYVIKNSTGEFFTGYDRGEPTFDATDARNAAHYDIGDANSICRSLAQLCAEPMTVEWHQ